MSNKERQRRWRARHPEQAAAHLEALKAKKAQDEEGLRVCDHEDEGVRVEGSYCGRCRQLIFKRGAFDRAYEEWLSRARASDDDAE